MQLGPAVRWARPAAVILWLTASATMAQATDERLPSMSPLGKEPANPTFLSTGAAPAGVAALVVPLPRPAPHRAKSHAREAVQPASVGPLERDPTITPTRVAYAAQPTEAGSSPSWLTLPGGPPPKVAEPILTAAVPDTIALPHLERRYRAGAAHTPSPDLFVLIENKAVAHGVPLELAHAVVRVESNYDPRLTGRGNTLGLMQIKYATARGMGFKGSMHDLYDPGVNLEWGMRYLAGAGKLAKGDLCGTVLRYQGGHMATRMTHASTTYCGKVRTLVGKSIDSTRVVLRKTAGR